MPSFETKSNDCSECTVHYTTTAAVDVIQRSMRRISATPAVHTHTQTRLTESEPEKKINKAHSADGHGFSSQRIQNIYTKWLNATSAIVLTDRTMFYRVGRGRTCIYQFTFSIATSLKYLKKKRWCCGLTLLKRDDVRSILFVWEQDLSHFSVVVFVLLLSGQTRPAYGYWTKPRESLLSDTFFSCLI